MRSIEYAAQTHVPAFLTKLWKLVTDVSCDDLISWSLGGTSFIIYDEIRFSKELLPMYFKHNNMASFVRQLNMYGFRKLSCIDQGGMHSYKSEIEFYHQYFIKGQESLLELIKRKIPNSKSEEPKVKQEYIDELITNIKSLKGKQDSAEQGMRHLRRENRMLWRHVHLLTDRSSKQQAVLQQIVPFFINMVHSSREVSLKRKVPLMIDEGEMQAKIARLSPPYYVEHNDQDQTSPMPSPPGNVTNRGPVIHDVTELETSKMYAANILCSPNTKECEAIVDSPLSCSLESSENTIDSPYTEPGSVEALNILNHNFERSNSLSPCLDVTHSSASAASPQRHHHLPSQVHTLPTSSQTSVSNYSRGPNGIPSVTIIDETTSDVPLSGNMMRIPFVPKIEDSCSNSSLYTINSMLSNGTPMMGSRTSSINEASSTPLINEASSSTMGEGTSSMMSESLPGSSQNKFFPRGFPSSSKSSASGVPWLMNPEPYACEPNIDNWLGQIFKSDNLVAGCSLPQKL